MANKNITNNTNDDNTELEKPKTRYRSTFRFDNKRYETTGKSQKEADQKAAVKKDRLERGEISISGDMSVERWAVIWLDTYKSQ